MITGKVLTISFFVLILVAMFFSTFARAYEYQVIDTPCPQIFCVKTTPYWKHQSWRVWIEQTEQYRPSRYYVERSVWSVALR